MEVTGIAVDVPASFLPIVAERITTLTPASACRDAFPPARMFPSFVTVTEAVFFFEAQSAVQLNPSLLNRFWEISVGLKNLSIRFHVVWSKVDWAFADTSTMPSDKIWPATSALALLEELRMVS